MSQSGWLPDWKDSDSYPQPDNTSLNAWAWEFLRRNPDYQQDYRSWKSLGIDEDFLPHQPGHSMDLAYCEPEAYDGETFRQYCDRHSDYRLVPLSVKRGNDYGLDYLHDPRNSARFVRFDTGVSPRYLVHDGNGPKEYAGIRPEKPGEVVVKLSLEWPIGVQVDRLQRILSRHQRRLEEKGVITAHKKRNHPKKYSTYLRLLDAEASSAKPAEIARQIFPDRSDCYPDYNGSKTVRDELQAANRLRDGNYRYLLFPSRKKKPPTS